MAFIDKVAMGSACLTLHGVVLQNFFCSAGRKAPILFPVWNGFPLP
jgi:hypothetical protein